MYIIRGSPGQLVFIEYRSHWITIYELHLRMYSKQYPIKQVCKTIILSRWSNYCCVWNHNAYRYASYDNMNIERVSMRQHKPRTKFETSLVTVYSKWSFNVTYFHLKRIYVIFFLFKKHSICLRYELSALPSNLLRIWMQEIAIDNLPFMYPPTRR